MPTVINSTMSLKLEDGDFSRIMWKMNQSGWTSAWWEAKAAVFNLAGMSISDNMLGWMGWSGGTRDRRTTYTTDVFIRNGDVCYLSLSRGWMENIYNLELGMISKGEVIDYELLRPLFRAFRAAIYDAFDGRKARHVINKNKGWNKVGESELVSRHLWDKKYDYVSIDPVEQNAAQCLAQLPCYNQLLAMKKAGRPVSDIPNSLCTSLEAAGLVERLREGAGIRVSELGKRMLRGNDWMTVWLVDILVRNGVTADAIISKIVDGSEEVDVAVGIRNKTWIFELKGDNFEAGDAHPMVARRARFKPDQVVIITAGKISPDAKRILDDVHNSKEPYPIMIEGLAGAEAVLSKLITNTLLEGANRKCEELSKKMDMNLTPIWNGLYGNYHRIYKGEFVR